MLATRWHEFTTAKLLLRGLGVHLPVCTQQQMCWSELLSMWPPSSPDLSPFWQTFAQNDLILYGSEAACCWLSALSVPLVRHAAHCLRLPRRAWNLPALLLQMTVTPSTWSGSSATLDWNRGECLEKPVPCNRCLCLKQQQKANKNAVALPMLTYLKYGSEQILKSKIRIVTGRVQAWKILGLLRFTSRSEDDKRLSDVLLRGFFVRVHSNIILLDDSRQTNCWYAFL